MLLNDKENLNFFSTCVFSLQYWIFVLNVMLFLLQIILVQKDDIYSHTDNANEKEHVYSLN